MKPFGLEPDLDRELNELPTPRAPRTLLPRVLLAVQKRARRPWYERPWPSWPRALQAASVAALMGLVAGIVALQPLAQAATSDLLSRFLGDAFAPFAGLVREVQATAGTASTLWRTLLQPVVGYLIAFALLMSASCTALGAALTRLALGEAWRP